MTEIEFLKCAVRDLEHHIKTLMKRIKKLEKENKKSTFLLEILKL